MGVGNAQLGCAEPTGDQIARAVSMAQRNIERYSNDCDLGRTDEDWRNNVYLGALAEVQAEQFFCERGFTARIVDDDEEQDHDLDLEELNVEVKLRRLWTYRNPDLLLRYDEELSADIYLMVEAEKTPRGVAMRVTKWASRNVVEEHVTGFREDRPRVPREYLEDTETLLPLLKMFRDGGECDG